MTTGGATLDRGYRFIVGLLIVVAGWLLALPFAAPVQRAALRRYHLQTGSFVLWALQAPVPAMYSFYNRYSLGGQAWDTSPIGYPTTGTVNHFPVRLYTFGDSRSTMLVESDRHALTVTSTYRGQLLVTRWHFVRNGEGRIDLVDEKLP